MLRLNESHYDWEDSKSYIAITIFIITWLLIIKRWSAIKVGHSIVVILGCSLMVLFEVVTPNEVFDSIRGETLLLVVAFMIIHIKLEQKDLIEYLKRVLLHGNPTPLWFLARVSFLSGTLSALIMDSGAVTFLSPLVFRLCDENRLEIEPFVLALTTSANIGSIATVIGNAKNMIITENNQDISFLGFFIHMAPLAIVGLVLNTVFLVSYYRKRFIGQTIKSYKPPTTNFVPGNITTLPREISDSRTIESAYDTEDDIIVAEMISDSDGRDESDENNDDDSQDNEGENSSLLARRKRLTQSRPQYANEFSSSSDHLLPKRNYALEQVVYVDDDDDNNDNLSPWVIRRDNHNWNQTQNQPALTRFAWDAPSPESRTLQGFGSNIQKRTEKFIITTKNFFGNGNLLKYFFILTMFGMYIALFFEKSLGWTTVAVAALLLCFDGKNATNIVNKINWGLVIYLIGMFGIMRGLYTTQLPDLLWDNYEEMFSKSGVRSFLASIVSLSLMSTLLALSLTSIPAILLMLPFVSNIADPRLRNNAGYLLAWNVGLVGNLSARKSSAGLIVSEIAKNHLYDTPLIQPYEFSTWGKYSVWSTIIISMIGNLVISFFK